MTGLVIGPYAASPVAVRPADPRAPEVAAALADLLRSAVPDLRVEHVGSTAVPGIPGTGTIDLLVVAAPSAAPGISDRLLRLGFRGRDPAGSWLAGAPALAGSVEWRGRAYQVEVRVVASDAPDLRETLALRDALRTDPRLRRDCAADKRRVVAGGATEPRAYALARGPWFDAALRRAGIRRAVPGATGSAPSPRRAVPGTADAGASSRRAAPGLADGGTGIRPPGAPAGAAAPTPARVPVAIPRLGRASAAEPEPAAPAPAAHALAPILPPATIGILGGGQLGRMIAMAARAMGYRVAILDPDPECPARAVADRQVVGRYDDARAAAELAAGCAVVTYELEHVDVALVEAVLAAGVPVRPGATALRVTQDRLAERRWVEEQGARVARWREVRSVPELRVALRDVGLPARLKAPLGGYDGRSQMRIARTTDIAEAWDALAGPASARDPRLPAAARRPVLLVEEELPFDCELSVVVARGPDGAVAAFPVARNVHDAGILAESVAPAPVPPLPVALAQDLGERLARSLDVVGTLTAELFLLADGSLAVNELAPRVHNSAHWTIEACRTSQFEQHVRATCGLPLGSVEMTGSAAMVNLLGTGPDRPARLAGVPEALADPDVKLHLYDKRRVFDRRKMGHVTVVAGSPEHALDRARRARAALRWER